MTAGSDPDTGDGGNDTPHGPGRSAGGTRTRSRRVPSGSWSGRPVWVLHGSLEVDDAARKTNYPYHDPSSVYHFYDETGPWTWSSYVNGNSTLLSRVKYPNIRFRLVMGLSVRATIFRS